MPDIFSPQKRKEVMSKIKSKETDIELKMKDNLEKNGIEFVFQPKMIGHPDFFISPNVVIFCDGSFWHGNNWNTLKEKLPEGYWLTHIEDNMVRDKKINLELTEKGYIVLRFWDLEIKKNINNCIYLIKDKLMR